LVVDDEENIVKAIVRLLSIAGYQAMGTVEPDEAIAILRDVTPAILISDQRMPRMTGLELLIKAKTISPSTVRLLISAYSDIDVVIAAINDGHIYQYISKPWQEQDFLAKTKAALQYWQEALDKERIVKQSLSEKANWKALLEQSHAKMKETVESSVNMLRKIIQAKDDELLQHSLRVSRYALQVAKQLGLDQQRKQHLEYAGFFHDIGKIAIRDQILYKVGRLDENEFLRMKAHPVIGAEILRELFFLDEVAEIVLQHHEKYDGSGYPSNLKGEAILLEARIIAVVDAYDALVSKRVYREGLPQNQVLMILAQEAGSHFDPVIVELFSKLQQVLGK